MPVYNYDHIHLRTRDPQGTVAYYHTMFDAQVLESIQSDGKPRVDLDINGVRLFIAPVAAEADMLSAPEEPHLGLDHFGLRVDNIDEAYAELTRRGSTFTVPPKTIRPGVRIAFVQAPDNVRIELLERT